MVGNDDLELEIRIGDLTKNLQNDESIDHWKVLLRYMTLLNRKDVRPEKNPVGFEPIMRGLWSICRESRFSQEQNLILLDRLEEMLQCRLPGIYVELHELLERHRIEPAQTSIVQRSTGHGSNREAAVIGEAIVPNAIISLHQALRQQSGIAAEVSGNATTIPFYGNADATPGWAALNASAMVMLNHLMERLSVLESQRHIGSQATAEKTTSLHALKSKDIDFPLGGTASVALDTLSMIFEAIFATPDLPDSVKTTIDRLQIPLLRRAILDPDFFNDIQHPGRQAVSRMARAAMGLPRDTRHDHPICIQISNIADAIRLGLNTESGDITAQLEALDVLTSQRDQAIQKAVQPYIQLVNKYESHEAARIQAQSWLMDIQKTSLPKEVSRFYSQCWLRVMEKAYITDNDIGEHWKFCESAARDLLWSIQPKKTADERKDLLRRIPALLTHINTELDQANISAEERKPFLDACFDLQTASLRNRPDNTEIFSTAHAPTTNNQSMLTTPQLLKANDIQIKYQGQGSANLWRGNVFWKTGDWIAFEMSGGETLCGLLCWQGPPFDSLVIFNDAWGYAIALPPSQLDQQFRNKQATVASNTQLFDDAAARALGQMHLV